MAAPTTTTPTTTMTPTTTTPTTTTPTTTTDSCGNYTVNYDIEDLVQIYTKKLVLKLVKEKHPELYKDAEKQIRELLKNSSQ